MSTIFETKQQNHRLKELIVELHWMARRYCDGRQSHVTGWFNEITRELQQMGLGLRETADGTIWARDAQGRNFDGLTEDEANQGKPLPEWSAWQDEETLRLRETLQFYGNHSNWSQRQEPFAFKEFFTMAVYPSPVDADGGKRARQALGVERA